MRTVRCRRGRGCLPQCMLGYTQPLLSAGGCMPQCMLGYTPPCGQNDRRLWKYYVADGNDSLNGSVLHCSQKKCLKSWEKWFYVKYLWFILKRSRNRFRGKTNSVSFSYVKTYWKKCKREICDNKTGCAQITDKFCLTVDTELFAKK